jgi:Subtilase family
VRRSARADAAEPALDVEQQREEITGRKLGLERGGSVEEARLVDDADGLGVDEPGHGGHADSRLVRQLVERRPDRRLAVAKVRAEADVGARHPQDATLRSLVARRLPIVLAAALCALGVAAVAHGDVSSEWWLHAIDADPSTAPGPGVPIVIVDGAVDASQPAFSGRANTTYLDPQALAGPNDFHATAVASLAAASTGGLEGVYPQASLELWDAGRGADGIDAGSAATGISMAARHCPAVINLSFGGIEPNPQVQDAILGAVRQGCLVVAAAGNSGLDGNPPTYPAAYAHVLTVGATDAQGVPLPFSSSGLWVDLAAPGTAISADVPLSHDPSGISANLAGTSFAAPLVTAAAAWLWTVRPKLTASQVAAVLRGSAHPTGSDSFDLKTGYGILDLDAALALPTPPNDPDEPNDDVVQVKPGQLFSSGEPPLTTPNHISNRIAGTLLQSDDPRDLYRVWVPAHGRVHVTVSGDAVAHIWGPRTYTVDEPQALRKRDFMGSTITGGSVGRYAYAEVELSADSPSATYVLSVRAARR